MRVSVVGLGKLGSPMAAIFAAKGHEVVGVDLNQTFVDKINAGEPPVFEPGLAEMIEQTEGRLTATTEIRQAVLTTDVLFIIVPTPSDEEGAFTVKYALEAARQIGEALREREDYFVVVLTSTVMPGDTASKLVPALEKASGKRCTKDFGVCYSPEFIALGSVLRDYLYPDFILIGESDQRAGDLLSEVYAPVHDTNPPIARMSYTNAELSKIALNGFVTTKISYANMLAQLCERLEGGNVDDVSRALGFDTRIGSKYLKGSLGYGGPCFPRDNVALATVARRLGVPGPLPEATDCTNRLQVPRLVELVKKGLPARGRVGIVGLAYKPDTNVIERSQGVEIAKALLDEGYCVEVYDPCAMDNAKKVLSGDVTYAESLESVATKADVLLITTPSKDFRAISAEHLKRQGHQVTVIDCWRLLDREALEKACHYVAVGTSDVGKLEATKTPRLVA